MPGKAELIEFVVNALLGRNGLATARPAEAGGRRHYRGIENPGINAWAEENDLDARSPPRRPACLREECDLHQWIANLMVLNRLVHRWIPAYAGMTVM